MGAPTDSGGASEMSAASRLMLEVLKRHCSLAWPIMKTQCSLAGLDPCALTLADVKGVVPAVVVALTRFTSEAKARSFRDEITLQCEAQTASRASGPRPAFKAAMARPVAHTEVARQVLDVLQSVSPLAWSLFEAQCVRQGADAARISADELADLLPHVHRALARFSTESRADDVVARLRRLTAT